MRSMLIRIAAVLIHIVLLGIAYHLTCRIIDRLLDLRFRPRQRLPAVEVLLPIRFEPPRPK
jgi:hypothetical protein